MPLTITFLNDTSIFLISDLILITSCTVIGFYDDKKSVDYYLPDTSMYLKHLKASQSMDRDYYLDGMDSFYQRNPEATRTKGYKERFAKHKSFYSDLYPTELYPDQ